VGSWSPSYPARPPLLLRHRPPPEPPAGTSPPKAGQVRNTKVHQEHPGEEDDAGQVAEVTWQTVKHVRDKGFDDRYYLDLILLFIREHGPVSRKAIDDLLLDKLPEILNLKQKRDKIHNLLHTLSKDKRIVNSGSKYHSRWEIVPTDDHR
jgi:ATP-dependent DNA helicase RecG